MTESRCVECTGSRLLRCNAVRAVAKMGIEASAGFEPGLQAESILRVTERASQSLLETGCQLPTIELAQELTADRAH